VGTSKSQATPSGGQWTQAKRAINRGLTRPAARRSVVGGAVSAAGGLGGGLYAGHAGGGGQGTRNIGRAASSLAGFLETVRTAGLDEAVRRLDLGELQGRSAVEVVSIVADHLSQSAEGTERELLMKALEDALLEIASLGDDLGYEDLETALQTAIDRDGIAGVLEIFLARVAFESVWFLIENHAQSSSSDEDALTAFATGIEEVCRSEARDLMAEKVRAGQFDKVDWFGAEGIRFGQELARQLEQRLAALSEEGGT